LLCIFLSRKWKHGKLEFLNTDKMELKNYAAKGVRVVPGASARYGSYISSGVIMMPSYVNIGLCR
jgi:2,3,4,5-tetrahydropyridine-2-carboxylate N-succinyltransferase